MRCMRSTFGMALMVGMMAGCARSPQAAEAKYLEKGRQEFQKKNYGVAIIHFKNAMQAQPRDAEPYYQLGLSYLAVNDFNAAASFFMKATELNPKHRGAQLKLAELMTASQSKEVLEDAQKRSQEALNLLPEDIEALNVLAIAELRLGKPESAEAHLEQALRKAPGDLKSSIALAQTKLAQKDVGGAEETLKQAAAQAPRSPEPAVHLGGFYLALGKTAEAEQQFRRALQIDPKYGPALVALGSIQVRAGQSEQADQTYRQVSGLPEKQYRPAYALYLFESGKREAALTEFEKLAKADPTDRNVRTNLVRAYLALNRVGDAERVLAAALKKNGLDTDALLQRSRIYLGSQRYVEAQADLVQVLHFRNDSAEAHYLLAKVHQGLRNTVGQQQELGEALRVDPAYWAARVELARVLTLSGGAQSALQLLDQAPQGQRLTAPIVLQRNTALLALGQTAEARKGIDQVLASVRDPEALVQDAALKLGQKDYAGARASAEAVLSQSPEDTRALNILAQSYAAQNQKPVGLQKAREYAARQPASARIQQFLGQLLLANGDRQGARKAFEAAQSSGGNLVTAELWLADMDMSEGDRVLARNRLSSFVATHPKSAAGQLLLAQLEMNEGKSSAAIDRYRKALELDPRHAGALNNLAYLLCDTNQPDEALKYAQQAKQFAPDNPAIDDTLGWTYYQKGMYSLAVTYLQSAVARGGTARREYHLAMACLKAGDAVRGREALTAALKMDPNLPEARAARQVFEGR